MASPAVSTPSSAGSPAALAPAPPNLAIMPSINGVIAGSNNNPSITSKNWVIPPRPKPGRKPATDTPPTKRKAQNRQAQRAFRERKTALVGELQEQLETEKKVESELRNKVIKLEADVEKFRGEIYSYRLRCDTLDQIAEYERREKESALAELAYLRNGARTTGTDAVPLPPRRPRQQAPQVQAPEPMEASCGNCTDVDNCACMETAIAMATTGCGKCTTETHCECLEETLNNGGTFVDYERKRSLSPHFGDYAEKRQRVESDPSTPLEVDFTAQFSKPIAQPQPIHQAPAESCGFCETGTYCMCAEAANAVANARENRLAPLLNEVTPPPSEPSIEGNNIKLPCLQPSASSATTNSCVNGPGTCQQCLMDPKSGLFCRSLAAIRESSGSATPGGGCCGGNKNGGGCCKDLPIATPSQPPPTLTCADTYKTLSTHKNFDKATDELGSWVGQLLPVPDQHSSKTAMEVEAASVMGVLKLFDRRFGRG